MERLVSQLDQVRQTISDHARQQDRQGRRLGQAGSDLQAGRGRGQDLVTVPFLVADRFRFIQTADDHVEQLAGVGDVVAKRLVLDRKLVQCPARAIPLRRTAGSIARSAGSAVPPAAGGSSGTRPWPASTVLSCFPVDPRTTLPRRARPVPGPRRRDKIFWKTRCGGESI